MLVSNGSSSSHRVGVLLCNVGRFISCIDCHLSYIFPDNTAYATVAKQFESQTCSGPILSREALSAGTASAYAPDSEAVNRFDLDHNPTPMWVVDNGTLGCSAANNAAIHDYGYSRKEFLSMTMVDIRASKGTVPLLEEVSHKGTRHSPNVLWKHSKKDGS